jgi:hypothetical protein
MLSVKHEHVFPEDTLDLFSILHHWMSFVQVRVTAAVAISAAKRFRLKLDVPVAMLRVSAVHYANTSCDRTHHGSTSRQGTCRLTSTNCQLHSHLYQRSGRGDGHASHRASHIPVRLYASISYSQSSYSRSEDLPPASRVRRGACLHSRKVAFIPVLNELQTKKRTKEQQRKSSPSRAALDASMHHASNTRSCELPDFACSNPATIHDPKQ